MNRTRQVARAVARDLSASRVAAAGQRLIASVETQTAERMLVRMLAQIHGSAVPEPLGDAGQVEARLGALLAPYQADIQSAALVGMLATVQCRTIDRPDPAAPTPPATPGPTELILTALREAAAPLYAYQIAERVRAVDPHVTEKHVNTVIYRLVATQRIARPIGRRCSYQYTLTAAAPTAPPVQDPVREEEHPAQAVPRHTPAPATVAPEPPPTAPTDAEGLGITAAILSVLRSAGVPLTQPEIVRRVRWINPQYDSTYVGSTLYRQQRRNGGPIVAAGPERHRRYSLKLGSGPPGPSLPANDNMLPWELNERIFAELAERPTADYRHLALTAAGADDQDTVTVVRHRVRNLRLAGRVRRRGDGVFEVTVLH